MNSLLAVLLFVAPAACATVPAEPQAFYVQDGMFASSGSNDGYVQLTVNDDHGQLLLILHDDHVTALLDGEVLPGDRVVRDGDKVTVRDTGGETLYEARVLPGANSLVYPYDAKAYTVYSGAAGDWPMAYAIGERRKLIGVTTSPVEGALRAQLGLDEGAFVVETVTDGMPADLGGVEAYDVVTAVEGEPARAERLREILADKEPGETLVLTVLRKGQSHDLTLTVQEPREPEAFNYSRAKGMYDDMTTWRAGAESQALQELLAARQTADAERAALTEHLARIQTEIQKASQRDSVEAARRLEELIDEQTALINRQNELEAEAEKRLTETSLYKAGDATRWLMMPPDRAGTEMSADRMAQLEERLARLEELLERLADRGAAEAAPAPAPAEKP